jgi:hypothetical protein
MAKRRTYLVLLLALLASSSAHGGDEIAVIANKSVSISSMGASDLRPIYQTTMTSWAGGRAMPLNLPGEDATRKGFDAAVLGLDPDRAAKYWIDRKIRGGNAPPKTVPNTAMILKIVATKSEAIGYVPVGSVTADVKVIAKIRGGQVVAP